MAMDENAMFKALLKNQAKQPVKKETKEAPVQPGTPAAQPARPQAEPSRPSSFSAKGGEDAMFKALLHNRPPAPKPVVEQKPYVPPAPAAPVYQEPVAVAMPPPPEVKLEPVVDSIKELTEKVNQVQSLLKTVFIVLILTLLIGIAILLTK